MRELLCVVLLCSLLGQGSPTFNNANFQPPVEKCCVQAVMISTPQKTFLSLLLRTAATGLHEYTELTPHLYKASGESVLFDSPQLYEQRRRKKEAVQPVKKKRGGDTPPTRKRVCTRFASPLQSRRVFLVTPPLCRLLLFLLCHIYFRTTAPLPVPARGHLGDTPRSSLLHSEGNETLGCTSPARKAPLRCVVGRDLFGFQKKILPHTR